MGTEENGERGRDERFLTMDPLILAPTVYPLDFPYDRVIGSAPEAQVFT
jgi:hypothetical protein